MNLRIAIITMAGISSRFNKDIPEEDKVLKCLYYEESPFDTLFYHLIEKVKYADKIVIVGGFKYDDILEYIENYIPRNLQDKILTIYNDHFSDLSSGYSLYLAIKESFERYNDISEILYLEGDLFIDVKSFNKVVESPKNVLTFNQEPIFSNKSVVLYQNGNDEYHYLFNVDHGLLSIDEPFKAIFNSGQVWKFKDMELLKVVNENFIENLIEDTNLGIIRVYFELLNDTSDVEIIGFKHWVNCNTRNDYKLIKKLLGVI